MKHSSSFSHLLYHVGFKLVLVALLMAVIYWMVKLAQLREKRGKRKLPKVAGLNRQQRRQERAMSTRKRDQ